MRNRDPKRAPRYWIARGVLLAVAGLGLGAVASIVTWFDLWAIKVTLACLAAGLVLYLLDWLIFQVMEGPEGPQK